MEAVSSPLPSIQERQQIHRKLYEVCRNVFAVYQFQGQSDERLTALVSSLENVVYRSANNKAEYCKALKSRFTLLKARVNAMKRQAIANQTPRSSANNGVTSVEDQIVLSEAEENQQKPVDPAEIKLEEMKQHIPALILVIERIQQLLSNENLSDENRNRLTVQLEKFEKVKKVIQREVTLTCESKLQALELIEQHILPVVNKIYGSPQGLLDTGASSSCIEKEGSGVAFHWETEESGLIGLLKSIGAENLMDSCRQANILSVKQFKALSVEDLQSRFSLSPEEAQRIMSCLSSGVEEAQSIIRQPNVACSTERLYAQMMDHFKCPITQDVINEPVVASDGYTYEKEAISKWLESHNTSPLTGAPLPDRTLRPNFNLQSQIREFCALVVSHKSPL